MRISIVIIFLFYSIISLLSQQRMGEFVNDVYQEGEQALLKGDAKKHLKSYKQEIISAGILQWTTLKL